MTEPAPSLLSQPPHPVPTGLPGQSAGPRRGVATAGSIGLFAAGAAALALVLYRIADPPGPGGLQLQPEFGAYLAAGSAAVMLACGLAGRRVPAPAGAQPDPFGR